MAYPAMRRAIARKTEKNGANHRAVSRSWIFGSPARGFPLLADHVLSERVIRRSVCHASQTRAAADQFHVLSQGRSRVGAALFLCTCEAVKGFTACYTARNEYLRRDACGGHQSRTRQGLKKAARTLRAKFGPDYFKKQGSKGGLKPKKKSGSPLFQVGSLRSSLPAIR